MLQGKNKAEGVRFLRRAVSLQPNLSRANFVIGSLCLEAKIREGAVRYLEMATRAAPDNAVYWHQLGMAYADGDAQLKEAENAARRAAELEPRNLDYQLDLGAAQEAVHKLDAAERTYRKVLDSAPENVTGLVRLGSFLVNRRSDEARLKEGVSLLQKALKSNPKDGYALFSLGRFYLKQKQPAEAIRFLQKAVAISPDVSEIWYSLSRARQMSGDLVGAKKAMQRSQKLSETYLAVTRALEQAARVPGDFLLRRNLARRYAAAGRYANAIQQYEIGMQLKPQNQALRSELERYRKSLAESGQTPSMDVFYALTGAAYSAQRN
jgi:tetratricopeptide (TPR) repeat protein